MSRELDKKIISASELSLLIGKTRMRNELSHFILSLYLPSVLIGLCRLFFDSEKLDSEWRLVLYTTYGKCERTIIVPLKVVKQSNIYLDLERNLSHQSNSMYFDGSNALWDSSEVFARVDRRIMNSDYISHWHMANEFSFDFRRTIKREEDQMEYESDYMPITIEEHCNYEEDLKSKAVPQLSEITFAFDSRSSVVGYKPRNLLQCKFYLDSISIPTPPYFS